jgi:hypothetical protein
MPGSLSHGFDEKSSSFEREQVWAYVWALPYLEVASGSIPLFLITSEARAEARNSISRLQGSISPEPATAAAENTGQERIGLFSWERATSIA